MRFLARLATAALVVLALVGGGVINGMSAASASTGVLPVSVDLKRWAVTPGYQGAVNSCVPWTIDYAMLGWYSRYTGRVGQPFAPMYAYSQISVNGDYGADPATVLELAVAQGNAPRSAYPQGDENWKSKPTAAQRAAAAKWKIKGWNTLFVGVGHSTTIALLKTALATHHPVAIRMEVRNGFAYLAKGATATDTDTTTAIRGSHEVLAVGYDATGLTVQNSWGTGWANGGFGRISWGVVQKDVLEGETIDGFVQGATAPAVSAPVVVKGAVLVKGRTTRYTAKWNVAAGNTGAVTETKVWYQVDGGRWTKAKVGTVRATSWAFVARLGHRYRVAVRADSGTHLGVTRFGVSVVGRS